MIAAPICRLGRFGAAVRVATKCVHPFSIRNERGIPVAQRTLTWTTLTKAVSQVANSKANPPRLAQQLAGSDIRAKDQLTASPLSCIDLWLCRPSSLLLRTGGQQVGSSQPRPGQAHRRGNARNWRHALGTRLVRPAMDHGRRTVTKRGV